MALSRRNLLNFIIPSALLSMLSTTKAYSNSQTKPSDALKGDTSQAHNSLGKSSIVLKEVNFKQPYNHAINRSLQEKLSECISPEDFSNVDEIATAMVFSGNTIQTFNYSEAFTLTVGIEGQYKNILDAISGAVRMRPLWKDGRGFCLIKLLKNFVLDQQLLFDGGEDLSWIKIISVDDVVHANTSEFTKTARTYYDNKYLFFFKGLVRSPIFAFQIEENRDDSDVCAFLVTEGARLTLAPFSGARKFYVGIDASFGSEVIGLHNGSAPDINAVKKYLSPDYYLCDFSYSRFTAARFIDGVRVNLPLSLFEYCSEPKQQAILCIYGTHGNFQGSSVSFSKGIGWNIRDNSVVNIRDHKSIQCAKIGISSIHGSVINARCHHTEESDPSTSGLVKEPGIKKGLYGCGIGVRCESAAIVEIAGNDIRNCHKGIQAATGATISGKASDLSGCKLAFQGYSGSNLSFPRLWAKDVEKLLDLYFSSTFSSWTLHSSADPSTNISDFIHAEGGSKITLHHADISANSGIYMQDSSELSVTSSNLEIINVFSFFGSRIHMKEITWKQKYKSKDEQFNIKSGSFINLYALVTTDKETITSNVESNKLSSAGAIFIE